MKAQQTHNNGKQFFLVNRVALLCFSELFREDGDNVVWCDCVVLIVWLVEDTTNSRVGCICGNNKPFVGIHMLEPRGLSDCLLDYLVLGLEKGCPGDGAVTRLEFVKGGTKVGEMTDVVG